MAFASAGPPRVGFFHDVATGKTALALMTAWNIWGCRRIFVVCPTSALSAWEREIPKVTGQKPVFLTDEDTKRRREKLSKDSPIYVSHYEGLKTLFCEFREKAAWKCPRCGVENIVDPDQDLVRCGRCRKIFSFDSVCPTPKKQWEIDPSRFVNFDCLIVDEIHKCSAYDSLQSRICVKLSRLSKCVIGLSGTPFDRSLLEMFNVMQVIDNGSSLGNNFFTYRNKYFFKSRFEWLPKSNSSEILEKVRQSAISFGLDECWDLPEIVEEVRLVIPSPEQIEIQKKLRETNTLVIQNTEYTLSDRRRLELLHQMCNGFLYLDSPHHLSTNPKIDTVVDIIEESQRKVIIFYHYREDNEILKKALEAHQISCVSMYGGQSVEERRNSERLFSSDPKVKVLLAQWAVANEGWDGTAANVVIFYTPSGSPRIRKQCHGRIRRPTQKERKLVSIDLALQSSVEELIIKKRGDRFDFVRDCMCFLRTRENNITNRGPDEQQKGDLRDSR